MATKTFSKPGIWVESGKNLNGRYYYAWKSNCSRWFGDRKLLLRWLAWPPKTPTGDELRAWLDGLDEPKHAPVIQEPEQALDPSDPQYATRTVI